MVLNDNVGIFLAGIFRTATTGSTQRNMIDILGVTRNVRVIGSSTVALINHKNPNLNQGQVGKGLSTPTRQDVTIESPFTNGGAEDNPQIMSVFGYNSGLGKMTAGIPITPTAGAGAISEVVTFFQGNDNAGVARDFLMTRDLVVPVVNFITAQTINLELVYFI